MSSNSSNYPYVAGINGAAVRSTRAEHDNAQKIHDIIQKPGCPELPDRYIKVHSGKVRETYQHPYNPDLLIMVATDRISTHDIIHKGLVDGKGKALTNMSKFWFGEFRRYGKTNRVSSQVVSDVEWPEDFPERYRESSVIVKKLKPLPIEAIVRGYLYGSALKGYDSDSGKLSTGEFVGTGLQKCSQFSEPLFTPSTKSDSGDINVNFDTMVQTLREWLPENGYENIDPIDLANTIKDYSLRMYNHANRVSQAYGMVLGDTKFEFGLDKDGRPTLIDEACTADSSRLWTSSTVKEGQEPESHDKQPARDYIEAYWSNHPDENGKYYGEKEFKKYPVEIPRNILNDCTRRYAGVSGVFQQAA